MNDQDRMPWLGVIRDHLLHEAKAVQDMDVNAKERVVIVTCSSLKKFYRDILRDVPKDIANVIFVYMKGSQELLLQRIQGRQGHFMPASMLQSQLDVLEEPTEEEGAVITASIIPRPEVEAKNILAEAIKRGYLPSSINL